MPLNLPDEWVDFDVAMHAVGVALGVLTDDFARHKGVYWTHNPVSEGLTQILDGLVKAGVLLCDDDARFRLNPAHDSTRPRAGAQKGRGHATNKAPAGAEETPPV